MNQYEAEHDQLRRRRANASIVPHSFTNLK